MKKSLLFIFCMISLVSAAQTIVLSDSFDTYTAGAPLASNSPLWTTWSGGVAGEDANVSSAQSSSAPNSVYVIGNNGPTDLVLPFPANYTTGIYELSLKMYVVAGKGAYFNLQQSMSPGVAWMFELYCDTGGVGSVNAGGTDAATFSYTPDAWNDIRVNVNLTADTAMVYVNNTLIHTWQWSLASDGSGAAVMLGGMNIYAAATPPAAAEFYVDDVVLTNFTVSGISEALSPATMEVFPNPSRGNFELVYFSNSISEAKIQLFNLAGGKVMEKTQEITPGKNSLFINEPLLTDGMYFLRLLASGGTVSQKIVIEN